MDFILEEGKDKIKEYLVPRLTEYIFDELSYDYLKKANVEDLLKDVPVPINKKELQNISTLNIAQWMAFVIGCDPSFTHRKAYIDYILRTFTEKFALGLINLGVDYAAKEEFEHAAILFRAALLIDENSVDALYCYGRACKDAYENGETEDYVARFKAESMEAFEELTLKKEDFDMGYYFLGYAYLNLGLYIKAKLTFDSFMKLSDDTELRKEIRQRVELLEDPVKIEEGYNLILSQKYYEGIEILSKYKEGAFQNWWPLWYYLGVAYRGIGEIEEAIEYLKKVLLYSPSNIETIEMLVELYEIEEDEVKTNKYKSKLKLIKENIEKDKLLKQENLQ